MHTIGNLTLTGYNPSLSNKAFETKRVAFQNSKLSLNAIFSSTERWNAEAIEKRGTDLAQQIATMWKRSASDQQYAPPVNRGTAAEIHRERRARYWAEMSEMLESSQTTLRPVRPSDGNICDFYLPMADVALSARFAPAKHHLTLRLYFSRARGREMFAGLQVDREAIEQSMTIPTAWDADGKPSIVAIKTGVSIRDRYEWLDHHKWIAEALAQFETSIINRLKTLHETVKEKSASRQLFLEYWIAFHHRMFERKIQLLATTPLPHYWNNFAIGRSGAWTYASVHGAESRIAVSLIFDTGVSPIFFPQLEKVRAAIESEIGAPLEWKSGDSLKQWRVSLNRDGIDIVDRDDWVNQHDWLIDNLVKFDAVFRKRIQNLSLSDE